MSYQKDLDTVVSRLSTYSTGLYIEFKTASPSIAVKLSLVNKKELLNTSDIASRGLDLYCFYDGSWQYVNSAIPVNKNNQQLLISHLPLGEKLFRLNLPLFDTIDELQIGISSGFSIAKSTLTEDKIVFYGTSITQGTGASRPGMAYPSIVGRELGVEVINLGFSGQGKFQLPIADILCSTNADMFVLDCTPNSSPELIEANAVQFIKRLRACKPDIPILLIESVIREYSHFNCGGPDTFGSLAYVKAQNSALRKSFDDAVKSGVNNIYYLEAENLLGNDHEATVDGTHPSDLGYLRIAEKVTEKIASIRK